MPNGSQAEPDYKGELQPLYIVEAGREYTGKEARNIELAEVFGDTTDRYITYGQTWSVVKARLQNHPRADISKVSGMARGHVYELLRDGSKTIPEQGTIALLTQTLRELERGPNRRVDV